MVLEIIMAGFIPVQYIFLSVLQHLLEGNLLSRLQDEFTDEVQVNLQLTKITPNRIVRESKKIGQILSVVASILATAIYTISITGGKGTAAMAGLLIYSILGTIICAYLTSFNADALDNFGFSYSYEKRSIQKEIKINAATAIGLSYSCIPVLIAVFTSVF